MADTPRILWTIMAFPFVHPYLSLSVHVLSLMCHQCPIWIVTLLFIFSAMTPSTMYSPLMPLSRCFLHLIYLPIYVFSLYVNTCSRSRTSLHVAVLFWRFQPPDALMLSRLYRKVNPFRSDLLLLLLTPAQPVIFLGH
jgi:hypothetical protein